MRRSYEETLLLFVGAQRKGRLEKSLLMTIDVTMPTRGQVGALHSPNEVNFHGKHAGDGEIFVDVALISTSVGVS